jgi:hypothetical protein
MTAMASNFWGGLGGGKKVLISENRIGQKYYSWLSNILKKVLIKSVKFNNLSMFQELIRSV